MLDLAVGASMFLPSLCGVNLNRKDLIIFTADTFLYNFSLLCEDEKQAVAVKSQLQQIARPMYSNPPVHGAMIVSTILGDPELRKLWLKEVKVIYYPCVLP